MSLKTYIFGGSVEPYQVAVNKADAVQHLWVNVSSRSGNDGYDGCETRREREVKSSVPGVTSQMFSQFSLKTSGRVPK